MDMEVGFASGLEDDLFYADLSRRISLLIMDEEEEEFPEHCPDTAASFQAYYYSYGGCQSFCAAQAPVPMQNEAAFRRETKGTGVFIPRRSSQPRKSRRPSRSRQGEKAGRAAAAAPATNSSRCHCRSSSSSVLKK